MLATPELIREAAQPYRLGAVLPRWLSEVPLYQSATQLGVCLDGGKVALESFRRLPLITKQDIRRGFPGNFLRPGVDLDALLDQNLVELEHTSGTSEERTPLLLGRGWWARQEERALRLNRFVARVLDEWPAARRVTITSPVCNGDICYTGVPSRADRIVGRALSVNLSRHPFLWSETDLARMAAEAAEWQPVFLDVDPVYGVLFALYCERRQIRLPSLRFVLCSYEFVSVAHRRILERVWGVPVFNLYGSTETGHLLMESAAFPSDLPTGHEPAGTDSTRSHYLLGSDGDRVETVPTRFMKSAPGEMRPSLDTAVLEVIEPDARGVGELVVTTLTNDYMPLIRYRIGDLMERREQPYRTTFVVQGRAADAFVSPNGERVTTWQIDECFAETPGVAHYQLLQPPGGGFLLRFVADRVGPRAAELAELKRQLSHRLGIKSGLSIQQTDSLMPESSGKFRLGYPAK